MAQQPLILVVDDHEAGRFAKVQRLRRAGYQVLEAQTGRETLDIAAREHPDVVLLDVNLPDIGGFDVCRQLKSLPLSPAVQVLHLSSTSITPADRAKGLTSGADAYLTEPVDDEVLLATLGALLRVRLAEQALAAALKREQAAREAAEQANRFKDDFLATLSHELRTPLSAMVGWIWQLRHGIGDDTLRRRAIDALDRSTAVQVRLINDLLDVSRIGRGKLELELARVDLSTVLESAIDSVQALVKAKQLVLNVSVTPVQVMGDVARLQQVLGNLLTNAVQFSNEGSYIDVSVDAGPAEAVVRVADHGQGIAPELLPHIFDPFRQGDGSLARRHGGLGLGLSIVRQLVSLHGGTVKGESAGPGHGATFTVCLPQAPVGPAESKTVERASTALLDGLRVLVVDDDDDSRTWLRALLESTGAQVATASSAVLALDELANGAFDLLVSDIGMPEADGLSLLRAVRKRGYALPAVAVTAFSTPEERQRILASGYRAHFAKPIQPEDFLRQLAAMRE